MRRSIGWISATIMAASSLASAQGLYDPNAGLIPVTEFDGPALEFDFPGVSIGVAEYAEGPTGTTVVHFDERVMGVVDVRGGGPGTMNATLLEQGYENPLLRAIVFLRRLGLRPRCAAAGASKEIKSLLDDPGWFTKIAVVGGAIIFDLGGRRYNAITPDENLGRAAIRAMRPGYFPLGARGAGRFAMQGGYYGSAQHSGQGGAFGKYGDVRIAVFTVVNAVGGIVNRDGRLIRCGTPVSNDCPTAADLLHTASETEDTLARNSEGLTSNTTITLVVTNQQMSYAELQRFAMQTHTSMGRAIQPFHTINDGDTLYAVTTAEVRDESLSSGKLGVLASELAWDAVLSSVPTLDEKPRTVSRRVSEDEASRYTGTYRFAPNMVASVSSSNGRLLVTAPGRHSTYLPANSTNALLPAAGGDFLLDTERRDVIRFETDAAGSVSGMTINPGQWPVHATRVNTQ